MISKDCRKRTRCGGEWEILSTCIFLEFVGGPHGQNDCIREKKSCLGLGLDSLKKISAGTSRVVFDDF